MMTLAVRPLAPGDQDHAALVAALTAARLPTNDLGEGGRFYVLHDGGEPLAFGGLDGNGADVMLRSVVVPEGTRGQGHGRTMVCALVEQAQRDGVERLWLLTTTAAPFFAGLGWTATDRADAPAAVRESQQFRGLCPASAVLMCRTLP
jgi:amino-acid N-acetyltransferase